MLPLCNLYDHNTSCNILDPFHFGRVFYGILTKCIQVNFNLCFLCAPHPQYWQFYLSVSTSQCNLLLFKVLSWSLTRAKHLCLSFWIPSSFSTTVILASNATFICCHLLGTSLGFIASSTLCMSIVKTVLEISPWISLQSNP